MKKGYFTLLLVLALVVSAQAVVVPNGDFELIRKPGSTTITGILLPSGGSWTQGVGPDCPIDNGEYEFSDVTTGTLADISGWVGYDRAGWIELGGSYGRDETTGNLQGSVANQFNHTEGGTNCYLANGADWGNPSGGLIVSSAPLDIADRSKVYVLSIFAKGVTAETPESPLVLKLLVNGVERTPDLSSDPVMTIEWQEYTRTYETLPAGDITIVLGFGRNATGAQMHLDDVTLVDAGEAGKRATNPNPANYAISVPLNKTLSWTAPADVVSPRYNVYLGGPGDPNADTLVSSNLTVTSYTPTTALNPGQIYYWKINVKDLANVIYVGYVWKFTTIPAYASDPDPPKGATGVFRNKILSWTAGEKNGAGPLSHTLYMDPNEAKVTNRALDVEYKVTGLLTAEYDPAPALVWGDHFFWRVDEVYATGTVENPAPAGIWEFTVAGVRACEDNPADVDGDCLVNINDFAVMAANWLKCSYTNDECPE
jgi:hypothetical protein